MCAWPGARGVLVGMALLLARPAAAQEPEPVKPPGLPGKVQWSFGFDAGLGVFGFSNSLYLDVRPDPSGDLSDNWFESYVKAAFTGTIAAGRSEFFAGLSAVGARTFAAPPPLVGEEASSFQLEDAYLGWRSGTAIGVGEDALEFTIGRAPYQLGHGFLLWDGAGEGGSRGGYWTNARKAWQFAGLAAFTADLHTIEAFYLDRDELPEAETGTSVWGANYELSLGDAGTLGATWMRWRADASLLPERDGLTVYNLRAFTAPIPSLPGLAFELEYAREENGELLRSTAWTAQAGYEVATMGWKPRLTYRYAFFEGDDPGTPVNESFDTLLPGFYDWGTWWQGEIAGEYFLANSNLISHQVRLHLTPDERVSWGLIGYSFRLDQPATFAPGVTAKQIATELDGYLDWNVNDNVSVSVIVALANPQEAAAQGFQRTSNFTYGMLYLSYSF